MTPSLDALAREGVLFEEAWSPAPLTLPSHVTIMTGLVPRHHGVRDNAGFRLDARIPTLASILRDHGYSTAAAVGAAVLDRSTGISRGFQVFDDRVRIGERSEFNFEERAATDVTRAATTLLRSLAPPFFLWVHYYDPHFPYVPPAPLNRTFARDPYDGEIAFADAGIGRLLSAVEEKRLRGNTLVVVAGDHGESLGEHGEAHHDLFVYQATQRVPLLVQGPGIVAGKREKGATALSDLLPSILDLLSVPVPEGLDGRSFARSVVAPLQAPAPGAAATDAGPRAFEMESFFPAYAYGWAPPLALVRGGMKYIAAPRPELYDLDSDPGEERNLLDPSARPISERDVTIAAGLAAELQARYRDDRAAMTFRAPSPYRPPRESSPGGRSTSDRGTEKGARSAAGPRSGPSPKQPPTDDAVAGEASATGTSRPQGVSGRATGGRGTGAAVPGGQESEDRDGARAEDDPERREQLAALGYVGGSVAPGAPPFAGELLDPKDGAAIVRDLDRAREALQSGDPARTLALLEPLTAAQQRNFPLLATLAAAYLASGDYEKAVATHRATTLIRPEDPLTHANLAGALRARAAAMPPAAAPASDASRLRDEAAQEFENALALNARDSESYLVYAGLELDRGKPDRARAILARAVSAEADDPEINLLLGRLEASVGDRTRATQAFARALVLDPRSAAAEEGLGRLAYVQGDPRSAAAHYERALELAPTAALARTLGAIRLYDLADPAGALAAFRTARGLLPEGPESVELDAIIEEIEAKP